MTIILYAIPMFLALLGLEVWWDARGQRGVYRMGDTLANLGCGIMDQTTGLLAKLATVAAFTGVYALGAEWRGDWAWPETAGGFAAAFVLGDFAYYWSHRWSHRVNVFWIGHVVHHQSEDYNLGVALRQSAAQKLLMMWVYWPLAWAGVPPWMFASAMALNLVYQFWIHTEAIRHLGPLEWLLNTPSHHRVHHGRDPEYIDKNHGGVFIVWDRLFGTFQRERQAPTYGITTPAATFNPVRAQVQPWVRLWRGVQAMPTLGLKLRYLFAPPGWTPDGGVPPPAITGAERKFEAELPRALLGPLLARWIVTLVGAFGLLLAERALPMPLVLAGIAWVLWNLWWVGATWDGDGPGDALSGIGDAGLVVWAALAMGVPVALGVAALLGGLQVWTWVSAGTRRAG